MATSQIWQYRLTTTSGRWVADVILRADGFFATVSDWGNYAYWWTAFGERDFRDFIAGLNAGYVASKIGRREEYKPERTYQNIRRRILTERREAGLTKESARKEWDLLGRLAAGEWADKREKQRANHLGEHEFRTWYDGTELYDASESACYGVPSDVEGFTSEVLPLLKDACRAELDAERAKGAA